MRILEIDKNTKNRLQILANKDKRCYYAIKRSNEIGVYLCDDYDLNTNSLFRKDFIAEISNPVYPEPWYKQLWNKIKDI